VNVFGLTKRPTIDSPQVVIDQGAPEKEMIGKPVQVRRGPAAVSADERRENATEAQFG
jgi:hypothetical protein